MKNYSDTTIKAKATALSDLLHTGQFSVPWHQRHYDWDQKHVRELLRDINEAVNENRDCYFLGTIMLIGDERGQSCWEINDGQQRMVTISLICAAFSRRFNDKNPKGQHVKLALQMLFHEDPRNISSLDEAEKYLPRISPPKDDKTSYHLIIKGNSLRNTKNSTNTLIKAWNTIEDFFSNMSLEKIEAYFNFLIKNIEVVRLYVPSDIDENAVYETINCRGKKLDHFDLIRNHLYSFFRSEKEQVRKESLHERLENIRTCFKNIKISSEYIRCVLQCEFGILHKLSFYNDFRKKIKENLHSYKEPSESDRRYIFNLAGRITSSQRLGLFQWINTSSPDPAPCTEFKIASSTQRSPRNLDVFLRELYGYKVSQPLVFSMLMLYMDREDKEEKKIIAKMVHQNLNRLANFILRTAFISKFEPSKIESKFSDYAKKISSSKKISDDEFINFLMSCDKISRHNALDDDELKSAIREGKIKGKTKIKHFLLGINRYLQKDADVININKLTIEHILPQSERHWIGWAGFPDHSDWIDKIGNLTLLGPGENRPGEKYNGNFKAKCKYYKNSAFRITRDLADDYDGWDPDSIEQRQEEMAKLAVKVWKFK